MDIRSIGSSILAGYYKLTTICLFEGHRGVITEEDK